MQPIFCHTGTMTPPRLANQGPLKFMPGVWESADVAFASGKRGMGLKGERERDEVH